jgi:hypothetical protein
LPSPPPATELGSPPPETLATLPVPGAHAVINGANDNITSSKTLNTDRFLCFIPSSFSCMHEDVLPRSTAKENNIATGMPDSWAKFHNDSSKKFPLNKLRVIK